jgi:hypothetical protein
LIVLQQRHQALTFNVRLANPLHLTAYGALNGPALFSRSIVQSPASQPQPGPKQQEDTYLTFLELLNVTSIDEARKLPSATLIEANEKQIAASQYSIFAYGSVPDDSFAPDFPYKDACAGLLFQEHRSSGRAQYK